MKRIFALIGPMSLLLVVSAYADVPKTIHYQGRITDLGTGNAIPDGIYSVRISLYESQSATATAWSDLYDVQIQSGYFEASLGSNPVAPLNISFDKPYWIGIKVGADSEMSPRQPLSSVPYSMQVKDASVTTSKLADDAVTYAKIAAGADLPIGTILAWHKSFTGTPALPPQYRECNGQVVNDIESPYYNRTLPDLNTTARFLRGGTASGVMQSDAFQGHWHARRWTNTAGPNYGVTYTSSSKADMDMTGLTGEATNYGIGNATTDNVNGSPRTAVETRPVNMTILWIIKIK